MKIFYFDEIRAHVGLFFFFEDLLKTEKYGNTCCILNTFHCLVNKQSKIT